MPTFLEIPPETLERMYSYFMDFKSLDFIAEFAQVSRSKVTEVAKANGWARVREKPLTPTVPLEPTTFGAKPPGHYATWGAITQGTQFEGCAYPLELALKQV